MPNLADYLLANRAGGNFGTMSPGEEAAAVTPGSVLDAIAKQAVTLPKRAFEASEGLRQTGEYDPAPAVETATMLAGGGMPMAEKNALGIFGGRMSKTADQAALSRAEELQAAGANRSKIFEDTGWFQGADKNWRYEIPDNAAQITQPVAKKFDASAIGDPVYMHNADRIMSHPELFEAYPDLWSVNTRLTKGGGYPYQPSGAFITKESGKQEIALNAPTIEDAKSLNLHELQHAVQAREGFSAGASPRALRDEIVGQWQTEYENLGDKLNAGKQLNPQEQAALNWFKTGAWKYPSSDLVMEKYRAVPGEIEARNVQERMNMTSEQRRASPPWATEDQ